VAESQISTDERLVQLVGDRSGRGTFEASASDPPSAPPRSRTGAESPRRPDGCAARDLCA
jgi:hypothetical protein